MHLQFNPQNSLHLFVIFGVQSDKEFSIKFQGTFDVVVTQVQVCLKTKENVFCKCRRKEAMALLNSSRDTVSGSGEAMGGKGGWAPLKKIGGVSNVFAPLRFFGYAVH